MSAARKRPRSEPVENLDNKAECPFSVRIVDPKEKDSKKKKRRRTEGEVDEAANKTMSQLSPFTPSGKFKTYETMDLSYQVEPAKAWTDMTRYNSFVLNSVKYFSEGFIYVANDTSVERQKAMADKEAAGEPRKRSYDDWVARILEIRASDEHHVYARVYWMYWPDELPANTRDGKKLVKGRQPYHGTSELIASNHMDIINVVSVTSSATVNQWLEENDEEVQNALYWRQALDVRSMELSSVELLCKCQEPGNPDKTLIGCNADGCGKWLHEDCIKHEALLATYKRLGKDKPHAASAAIKAEERGPEDKEEATRPLSPAETGAAGSAQQSIDVKSNSKPSTSSDAAVGDNVDVSAGKDTSTERNAAGSSAATPTPAGSARKLAQPRKKGKEAFSQEDNSKPYEGLFEVTANMDAVPPVLEFRDLREGIQGGEKTWTEMITCLVCGHEIV